VPKRRPRRLPAELRDQRAGSIFQQVHDELEVGEPELVPFVQPLLPPVELDALKDAGQDRRPTGESSRMSE
jgi:hypothetical protein